MISLSLDATLELGIVLLLYGWGDDVREMVPLETGSLSRLRRKLKMLLKLFLPVVAPLSTADKVILRPRESPTFDGPSGAGLDFTECMDAAEFDLNNVVAGPVKPSAEAASIAEAF